MSQMSHGDREINEQIKAFISEVSDLVAWAAVETAGDTPGLDASDAQSGVKRRRKRQPPEPEGPEKTAAGQAKPPARVEDRRSGREAGPRTRKRRQTDPGKRARGA